MKEDKAYIGDEIVEGNKLIAEFMGAEWCEDDYGEWGYKGNFPGPFQYRAKDNFKYHSSWDWLMPVMDKIERLNIADIKYNSYPNGDWQLLMSVDGVLIIGVTHDSNQKMKAHWVAVIEFIKWYNQNEK